MTGDTFLALTVTAAVIVLLGAWLVAQREHDHTTPTRSADDRPERELVDVAAAGYRAAIEVARGRSTHELLAVYHPTALDDLARPAAVEVDELLARMAAHHVLVAERGVIPLAAPRPMAPGGAR